MLYALYRYDRVEFGDMKMIVETDNYACHCNESTDRQEREDTVSLTVCVPANKRGNYSSDCYEVYCTDCGTRLY